MRFKAAVISGEADASSLDEYSPLYDLPRDNRFINLLSSPKTYLEAVIDLALVEAAEEYFDPEAYSSKRIGISRAKMISGHILPLIDTAATFDIPLIKRIPDAHKAEILRDLETSFLEGLTFFWKGKQSGELIPIRGQQRKIISAG